MILTVIGLGEAGTAISQLILTHYRNNQLNIVDINLKHRGRIVDLSHAGVGNNNMISLNDKELFEQSDYVFFCAGTRNLPGEPRETMGAKNHELLQSVFRNISFSNNPVVIVISNPVDAMVSWLSKMKLAVKKVIGTGTLLDTWRLKLLIAEHAGVALESVKTAIYGEHGEGLVVIWSQTFIDGVPITDVYGEEELQELELQLKQSAKEIRETENATKYGVGAVAQFLLDSLLKADATDTILSIGEGEQVAYGRPVRVSGSGIQCLPIEGLTSKEEGKLERSIKKIDKIVHTY